MTKPNSSKYLRLMAQMGWEGIDTWEDSHPVKYEKEITKFREWLRKNIVYIVETEVYDAMLNYYFQEVSLTPGTKYQKRVEQGRCAVSTLYNYQKIGVSA